MDLVFLFKPWLEQQTISLLNDDQTTFNHLNTGIVSISDPHCTNADKMPSGNSSVVSH